MERVSSVSITKRPTWIDAMKVETTLSSQERPLDGIDILELPLEEMSIQEVVQAILRDSSHREDKIMDHIQDTKELIKYWEEVIWDDTQSSIKEIKEYFMTLHDEVDRMSALKTQEIN